VAIQLNDEEEKDCRSAKLPPMCSKKMGVHCSRIKGIKVEFTSCSRPVVDGTNGPCEVCGPNCALSEISKSLAAPQNFDDLPQNEYGF
jgi:hypothetical protein